MRLLPYVLAAMMAPLTVPYLPQQSQQQPASAAAQKDGYTLKVNPRLVVLDVVVTDKQGNPVTNLKQEDFTIQEDKQPQHIFSFEVPAAHALPPSVTIHSTAELDRLAPNAATTILVLDEFSARFEDMAYARISIEKYLKSQPRLLAQPTMLVEVDVSRMRMLQDYTQDRDAVLAALTHYRPSILTITSTGTSSWMSEEINAGYRALAQVSLATMAHPGHKNVIWVGRGLPHFSVERRVYPGDVVISSRDALKLHSALQKVINLMSAARVTLYTIDPQGVGLHNNPFDGIASFAEVAVATGGKPVYNRNDVEAVIDTSMQQGNQFYTLSYIPGSGSDTRLAFHNIRILMKDPHLQATTRTGYFPAPRITDSNTIGPAR